ncbi:MAG: type III pantothenate kinase [Chlorobi bacterium]|nr:type III pantothenate kinase [Chlorobiota bacterium]
MNLAIDIGNSITKVALFNKNEIIYKYSFEVFDKNTLKEFLKKEWDIKNAIISTVKNTDTELLNFCTSSFNYFIELNAFVKLPFKVKYASPETLGNDRVAAVAGASSIFPGSNILIIDIGTAVTYDIINKNNEYLGGNISPGIYLRYRSLHDYTSKLPLLNISKHYDFIGTNTKNAIISGVQNGLFFEIKGFINEISNQFNDLKIVLTGGDSELFEKKIKNSIFVLPNLVINGLNRILEYNAKNK